MRISEPLKLALGGLMIAIGTAHGMGQAKNHESQSREPLMPALIQQFTADSMALNRTYSVQISPARFARMEKVLHGEKQAMLTAIDFDALSQEDKVDYLLLKNHLTSELHQLAIEKKRDEQMQPLLPFVQTIDELTTAKRLMQQSDAEKAAAALSAMVKQIAATRARLDPKSHGAPTADRAPAAPQDRSSRRQPRR